MTGPTKAMASKGRRYAANVKRLKARMRKMPESARHKARRMIAVMEGWLAVHERSLAKR